MTFLCYDRQDFYKRMLEIQEKLRQSEEERIRLEERFKLLMKESENRHNTCINRLRLRYIEFLEEQRDREDRNNKLKGVLDRVDSHLALMTAKSDRLNVLRKHYEAYLLQNYGSQRSYGSVTGDSGVTSQQEDKSSRKDLIPYSRRHSLQSVSIPHSRATTSLSSRAATPISQKCNEFRFVDPPRTPQTNLSHSFHQSLYSTPKDSYRKSQVFPSSSPQIPEIRISSSFPPTLVSRDVQTDKPANVFLDQSFTSVEPCQISGVSRVSPAYSTQTLRQFSSQFPHQDTPSLQSHNVSQYMYTPSLLKTNDLSEFSPRSRTEFSELQSRPNVFRSTSPLLSYPDYSWRYARSSRFEEKSPRLDKNSIFKERSIFDENSIFDRNSRYENKSSPRFFRRFDFNTIFKRNDRPLPTSKSFLSTLRTKPSIKPLKLSTSLKSDYDIYERSRKMDDELDRYIGRIRNLNRDVDLHSSEDLEHEQNTSGDLLNVTLSDDDLDLPAEEKSRENHFQERKMDVLPKKGNQSAMFGKQKETLRFTNSADHLTQINAPVSEARYDIPLNEVDETSAVIAADGISSNITKQGAKIESNENINTGLSKSVENSGEKSSHEKKHRVIFNESKDDLPERGGKNQLQEKEITFNELKEIEEENSEFSNQESEPINQNISPEDQKTNAVDSKIDDKEKPINVEDRKKDSEDKNKVKELEKSQVVEAEKKTENQGVEEEKLVENQDFVPDQNQDYQYSSNQDYNYDPNAGYDQYQSYPDGYDQYNQEYDPNQQYSQDPNQYGEDAHQYNQDPSQYNQDPSQYSQDPSQYSQDPNQYNQDPSQYSQDPGQYGQDPGQYSQDPSQYAADLNQYNQDSNQQYDPNQQFEQDPNQYAQDAQYNQDPNQYSQDPGQYSQDLNQQVEQHPNQQYAEDKNQQFAQVSNQEYSKDSNQYDPSHQYQEQYDPNQLYDPNQQYDYSQPQEYSQQDQSFDQQNQSYNSNQTYQNYTPGTVAENDSQKIEAKIEETRVDNVETSIKKKDTNHLESDTESTIERNASNTESDFDFN